MPVDVRIEGRGRPAWSTRPQEGERGHGRRDERSGQRHDERRPREERGGPRNAGGRYGESRNGDGRHQGQGRPGFDPLAVPLAVYDGSTSWLFRHPKPPAGFTRRANLIPLAWTFTGRFPAVTATSSADIGGVRYLPPANAERMRQIEAATPGAGQGARPDQALPNFDYLETLVGDSGGIVSRSLSQAEVINAAKVITSELQNEYLIGFTPAKAFDGKYRKLKVEVSRRGTFIRHRGGYLALPSQP